MSANGKGKKELTPFEKLELRLRQFKGRVVLAHMHQFSRQKEAFNAGYS